ncbi:hypothetical protein [Lactobacillus helveticus]|uniref:Uncharacterized protein n=1 Tax=Lactobacillus helveticus CIRM-BIA 953 TaxID=1226335 RepID=U4QE12_LACHE|nr:hypothetical protein [Lactobacillus helveticus]CDI42757.1 Putative uncharacterized protein [Lactobacillus helveticus CIRM-BIA 953]
MWLKFLKDFTGPIAYMIEAAAILITGMICEVWIYNIAWMFVLNIIRMLIEKAQAKK